MLVGLLLGTGWFCAFVLAHVALFHFREVTKRFVIIARLFGITVMADLGSTWLVAGGEGNVLGLLSGIVAMAALFVLYMPFYYTISASLSVRTLLVLDLAPAGRAPLDRLVERFASTEAVRERLETMAANGYLLREGEAYRLTQKGRWVARPFRAIKKVWRLGPGG